MNFSRTSPSRLTEVLGTCVLVGAIIRDYSPNIAHMQKLVAKLKNSNKKFELSRYYRTLQYFKSRYLVEFFIH